VSVCLLIGILFPIMIILVVTKQAAPVLPLPGGLFEHEKGSGAACSAPASSLSYAPRTQPRTYEHTKTRVAGCPAQVRGGGRGQWAVDSA
jgi:hypothetical protein